MVTHHIAWRVPSGQLLGAVRSLQSDHGLVQRQACVVRPAQAAIAMTIVIDCGELQDRQAWHTAPRLKPALD